MYDIAIIGLGPAGAALARLLDKRFKVIAIDKKRPGGDSVSKPCGGLLAPDAQKALSRFNLVLPKEVLVDPQIFAVKTIDTKQNLMRYYQRFYMNLDRHKFDMWLISLIPKTVTIASGATCTDVQNVGNLFKITYTQNGGTQMVKAKYVVGAEGANSIVRKRLLPRRQIPQYVSIQQWFSEPHQTPFYACVFDSEVTDSYCWSISKDGYYILGGAFPKEDSRERFELLKGTLEVRQGFRLGAPVKTEACLVSMPRGIRDFCVGRDGAFLIGEAAGFISPSSLEGISYALNSAYDLAHILNKGGDDPVWVFRVKSIPMRLKLLLKYLKRPFMYWPFLRWIVMKSGLKSIRVIEKEV